MIIGVTGLDGSGKDSVAEYFHTKGFVHISLSDIMREELKKRDKAVTRENLVAFANKMREFMGPQVLGDLALQRMINGKDYVVTSIRNPKEVDSLSARKGFMLIEVRAPQKLRYERVLKRSQSDTPPTLKEFAAREKAEQHKDSMKQQVYKVVRLAKVKVNNIGTFDDLRKKLDTLLDDWKPKIEARPSWDDYFMGVTKEVASRATCNRGRSGCVIVKDKRILTTGYVGSPVGVKHCDEVGHEMHSVVHDDGKISQHCIRTTHAEQNALMQAAKHGISIDGSTVYCKMEPCYVCAKMLINAGVTRIVCQKKYHAAQKSRDVFTSAGVELDVLEEDVEEYVNQ